MKYIPNWLAVLLVCNLILVAAFIPRILAPQIVGTLILCGIVVFVRSKRNRQEKQIDES